MYQVLYVNLTTNSISDVDSLTVIDSSNVTYTAHVKGSKGTDGANGVDGPTGATGATGAKGAKGEPGTFLYAYADFTLPSPSVTEVASVLNLHSEAINVLYPNGTDIIKALPSNTFSSFVYNLQSLGWSPISPI